jgi:hypothetical protein
VIDRSKLNQLFKAAKAGNVARIRELLAAGVPVDAQDNERMTPLMRAAQTGQAEAFRALVEAGADLHAIGMCQTDVLEMAAEGGNVEIVRFLLDKGMPLEGHWQPRSQEAHREGHITPLTCAAMEGHVEVVRLLLRAGADRNAKFDGESLLTRVKNEIKYQGIDAGPEQKQQYVEVAALLAESSSDDGKPAEDTATLEMANFARNALQPAYVQIRQMLAERCGAERPWQPVPDHGPLAYQGAHGVNRFTVRHCTKSKTITGLQEEVREAGYHLVLTEPWVAGEDAKFVLFPTKDKFAVIAAIGTEGANYGVQTADVIAWLRDLEKQNPFILRYCAHDLVGGDFLGRVKSARKLAEQMAEFCPSSLDEGFESPEELARGLTKSKRFVVRWD